MAMGRSLGAAGRCLAAALVLIGAVGCPAREAAVTVSGKTAYGELAVEGVAVTALRREGEAWALAAETRSGYHGSWVLRLPPGTYRLEAEGALPAPGGTTLPLTGALEGLGLSGGEGRVDRLVIPLQPGGGP